MGVLEGAPQGYCQGQRVAAPTGSSGIKLRLVLLLPFFSRGFTTVVFQLVPPKVTVKWFSPVVTLIWFSPVVSTVVIPEYFPYLGLLWFSPVDILLVTPKYFPSVPHWSPEEVPPGGSSCNFPQCSPGKGLSQRPP